MKRRGEITVFFSMILLCVFGLISVMLESARTAGARFYLQTAANSSIDSLFSQYHKELWTQYHLFGLEYESEDALEQQLQRYLSPYLSSENWYPMEIRSVGISSPTRMTEQGGLYLEQEILAYMKYGIWDELEIQPNLGEQLIASVKEAKTVQGLTTSYQKQSREVFQLEQAWDRISACLQKQREYHVQAGKELSSEDSSDFFYRAGKLETELKRIPGLVKAYEKQADRLQTHLEDMEHQYLEEAEALSGEMQGVMREELNQYRSYLDEDGTRRMEIAALVSLMEENLQMVNAVRGQVSQIEAYLEQLDEEEADESGAMWEEARGTWDGFRDSGLRPSGTGDEEKRGWLERIETLADVGLLEMVLPEGVEVSTVLLDLKEAPSGVGNQSGQTDRGNLINRILVNEYCTMHFSMFTTAAATEPEPIKALYEVEYLLGGKDNDRENLEQAVKEILAVREGLNLMHILTDSQKRGEARALALVITGAVGLAPLVDVTALFIMGVWALGESAADVKALLAGKKVPLIKSRADWNLSLDQLLRMGQEEGRPEGVGRDVGFSYESYLKLLLLTEGSERKYMRMMDVIQMNIRRRQEDFRMEDCLYRVDMEADVGGKHVFFALPFVENLTGSGEHGYEMKVRSEKEY